MLTDFIDILRSYPAVAIFLTVGIGFFIGRIRIGKFSLGSVTAVLLTGVIVGQLDISVAGPLKNVFFMMFLFSIGYSVGPQFFRSLKGSGLKQVLFAAILSSVIFIVTLGIAKIMQYSVGETIGLFSGSQTCSALMGVGTESISRMPVDEVYKADQISMVSVCYAVTYIFGTLGTVIILGNLGPKLLGGLEKVKRQTSELSTSLNINEWENDPACVNALRAVAYRSYKIDESFFDSNPTVAETEAYLREAGLPLYIVRKRQGKKIVETTADMRLHNGDMIVITGQREFIVRDIELIGHETSDNDLLSYPVDRVPVLVNRSEIESLSISEICQQAFMHGVGIVSVTRHGVVLEIDGETIIQKGDVLTLMGTATDVKRAADNLGHLDRPTISSDLMFVGIAIFIGGVIGALSITVGSIPVSFGTSGGALIAGLVLGWLRSRRPTFGFIPRQALWLMNNLGLNVFVAVIGIQSSTSFIAGVRAVGPLLLVAGAVATTIPLLIGIWMGHKLFKFHPAITLGCCAGTRTCTASLGAVQDTLDSSVPAIGYTVTYAVSNIMLVIWGMITVICI
ncbi:MAG: aspartate-alanine antiporter [Muribaculaceae bacterium]|nr:aspartate-alanine antiporter [Muribaculaceae bacterium]